VADVVYLGVSSAFQAKDKGVVEPYKPAHWDDIPANMKDPQGYWFTIHSGTLGFFVNKDALVGRPAQARVQRHGRLSRSVERIRRLCRRGRGESGARRHAR
jgi:ABC-type Fe3+ transport system substrate-binding protein